MKKKKSGTKSHRDNVVWGDLTPDTLESALGDMTFEPVTIPTQESVEELVDGRIEHFFSGKCFEGGIKDEFRKEMQTVAYALRKHFKEEIEKMSDQLKADFMQELKNL